MKKRQLNYGLCFISIFFLLFINIKVFASTAINVTKVSLNKTAVTLTVGITDKSKVTIAPTNTTNKSVKWTSSNATIAKADEIIANLIKPGMSDFQKELVLHDYVVLHTVYDYKNYINNTITDDDGSAYGVLINGTAVCQGYAEAMNLLLNKVGIESQVVIGSAYGVHGWEGHAWNIVLIDGSYYHLDTTFDDPLGNDGDDEVAMHNYFNVTDAKISLDHKWDKSYPICNTSKNTYNFYMYCKNNKINIDVAQRRISGTITLPDGMIAPKGGGKILVSAYTYTPEEYRHTNEYAESKYVIIPEGSNSAVYSFVVPLSKEGYTISYHNGSDNGYYSNEGTTSNNDKRTLVDVSGVSGVTQVDIKILKMYSIKGMVSLPAGEIAPKGGVYIRILAYIGKYNVYITNVTIAEGTNSISYVINIPQNNDGYKVAYKYFGGNPLYESNGYYSNAGTVTGYNKLTLVSMNNMTNVNFTILKVN